MQYTELTDKNNKEICEGDILKCDDGSVGKVVFHSGMFNFVKYREKTDDEIMDDALWEVQETSQVIGNIYENQELLECKF